VGVFKYNDKAEAAMRDVYGMHKAELRLEKSGWVLEISGTDIDSSNTATHWKGKWFKADQ
jgi:hypothetical protein